MCVDSECISLAEVILCSVINLNFCVASNWLKNDVKIIIKLHRAACLRLISSYKCFIMLLRHLYLQNVIGTYSWNKS